MNRFKNRHMEKGMEGGCPARGKGGLRGWRRTIWLARMMDR